MPTLLVHGARLSYRQLGRGPDLVLIHGLAANQAFWSPGLLARLARRFTVTAWDLPGHGYSEMPRGGYGPAELARLTVALLNGLRIDSARLVGHSYGGVIALETAALHPERIVQLAIVDSRLRWLQPEQPLRDGGDWPRVRAFLRQRKVDVADDEPELGLRLLEALASPQSEGVRDQLALRASFVPFAGRGGERMRRRWLQLVRDTSLVEDVHRGGDLTAVQLEAIGCPVLLSYGSRSPNLLTGRRLAARLPNVAWHEAADAGHFHPLTKVAEFGEALWGFLDGKLTSEENAPARQLTPQPAASDRQALAPT